MAISMLKVRTGAKGRAKKHYLYIAKDEYYEKDLDEVVYSVSGNLPSWATGDPKLFFTTADEYERANGTAYREHILSLPRELNHQQRVELVGDWIAQEMGEKYAYQAVIHNKIALDGGEQPHLHLMFSERLIDGIERTPEQFFKRYNSKNPSKGGCKKDNTGLKTAERKQLLKQTRERAERMINKHLVNHRHEPTADFRNWVQRGLDQKPHNMSYAMLNEKDVKDAYIEYSTDKRELNELLKTTDLTIAPPIPKPTAEPKRPKFKP